MELPKDETGMNPDPDGVLNEMFDDSDGGQSAVGDNSDLDVDLQISETESESTNKISKNIENSHELLEASKILDRMDVDSPEPGNNAEIHVLAASMSISGKVFTKNPDTSFVSPPPMTKKPGAVEKPEGEEPEAGSSADSEYVSANKKNIPDPAMKIPSVPMVEKNVTVVPPESYLKIISKIKEKEIPPKIGDGSVNGLFSSECGSFFNGGDGRALRSHYTEDICSLSVVSSSFNTNSLQCVGCPKGHSILEN